MSSSSQNNDWQRRRDDKNQSSELKCAQSKKKDKKTQTMIFYSEAVKGKGRNEYGGEYDTVVGFGGFSISDGPMDFIR